MTRPLAMDIRTRLVSPVADGMTRRSASKRIGLGSLAERACKGPHLGRIDDRDRQTRAAGAGCHHGFEAAGGFDSDSRWQQRLRALRQLADAFAVARDGKGRVRRQDMNVQPFLRNVDPDIGRVHSIPSLRKRARSAAQATVRVRWTGRRRIERTAGSIHPRGNRSSACHRTGHSMPPGLRQDTSDEQKIESQGRRGQREEIGFSAISVSLR